MATEQSEPVVTPVAEPPARPGAPPPQAGRSAALRRLATPRTLGPVLVLLAMIVTFSLLNEHFLTTDNALTVLRQGMVLLVVALGQTFVIVMGSIDISVGAIMSLVGLTGAILVRDTGSDWVLLLVLLFGAAAGAINGFLFAYVRLPSFLVTIGALFYLGGIALLLTRGSSVPGEAGTTVTKILGGDVGQFPIAGFWALGIALLCIFVAKRTKFGRYMYAIGGGEAVAELSGVPVRRYKFYAFTLCGALAGFAGLLLMFRLQGGDARMGDPFLLPVIAAVVIGGTPLTGGMGGPARTLLGVLIITVLQNGMDLAAVDQFAAEVVFGVVVILAVAMTMDRKQVVLMK
jgi:ribose transport system permease protein/putative xylitol transport system permease protein